MKSTPIIVALATAALLAALPGPGDAGTGDPWLRSYPRGCTPEMQKCLEKLEARLLLLGRSSDGSGIEQALLELHETDPGCALLLQNRELHGF
jgi:hypothetical protein